MKPLSGIFLFLFFFFTSCTKDNKKTNCNLTHAKVLRYDCDRVILQVLDGSINGDAVWTNVVNGNIYHNVVSFHNTCAFAAATGNMATDVYIEGAAIIENPQMDASCVQCQAVSPNPPITKISGSGFSSAPCNGNR